MIQRIKHTLADKENQVALRIAGVYLFAGALWILVSDRLLASHVTNTATYMRFSVYKGWGFIILTTLVLLLVIRRYLRSNRAGQEYLRLITASIPSALAYLDADLRYRFNNHAYEEWVGRTRAQIYGLHPRDVIGEQAYQRVKPYIAEVLSGKKVVFETVMPKADGSLRQVEITYIPDMRSAPTVQGFTVVVTDITESRQHEADLRASETRYRLLAENMADVVWTLDLVSMRFTYVSPSVERLRGYSTEEVLAQSLDQVLTPASLAMIQAGILPRLEAFAAGDPAARVQTHEVEQLCKDGSTVWTEVATTLMDAPAGGIQILGVSRDITLRKRNEESLHASARRLKTLFDLLPVGVSILDHERKIIEANPALEKILDRDRQELIHDLYRGRKYIREDGAPMADEDYASYQALQTGRVIQNVITGVQKENGEMIWTSVSAAPIEDPDWKVVVVTNNITEARRIATQLQQSEQRFSRAFHSNPVAVLISDMETREVLDANESFCSALGYSIQELRALGPAAEKIFTRPEDRPSIIRHLERDGMARNVETQARSKAGKTLDLLASVVKIQLDGRNCLLTSLHDITDRKRAEQELSDSGAQYRAVIETTSDGFCILDLHGRILEVNEALIRQSGYSRAELLAMRLSDLDSGETPDDATDQIARAVRIGSHIYEARQKSKDGSIRQVEVNVSYWPILDGRVFAFLRDIRLRKRSEALLRTRLQLSEMASNSSMAELLQYTLDQAELFTGSRIGFFHRIEDDQQTLTLQTWSTKTQQQYCTAEPIAAHYPIDGAGIWTDCFYSRAPVIHNDYASAPHRKGIPEGHAPLTRMLTTPLLHNGLVAAIMGVGNKSNDYDQEDIEVLQDLASIAMDIIARKQAEEAATRYAAELERRVAERTADLRRANTELEQASRAKDEFLASVSHELRTPLNAILTLAESLEEGTYGALSERQLHPLRTIAESGYHLLNLINDILDLSKIEAGKLGLQLASVEIEPLCQASLRLVHQQAENKRLQVEFQFDPEVKTVQTDPRRIKQMLVNLLGNAVKFTPVGGRIGLEVHGDLAAGAIHLTVWDTGIGISPEDARRLFHPFVQVDSRLARQYGGTGLGLSLVYRMAELHGGGVSLESIPGRGSRFTISLPWSASPMDLPGTRPLRPLHTPDVRSALLIADMTPAAQQLGRYLKELGARLTHTADGAAAVSLALDAQPDVILLDMELAGGLGPATLAQLKEDHRCQSIPTLLIADVGQLVHPPGAGETLMKPVTRQRLHDALWKALAAPGHPAMPAGAASAGRPLVLIAEDNPASQATYADYLAAKGYRILAAASGTQAIEMGREFAPDLILMDVQLPEIDGLEATRRLRADPCCAAIPIIAITALAMPGDRQRCLAVGMNEYLTKPVSLKRLAQTIETYLKGNHA